MKIRKKTLTADQKNVATVNERNDDVAKYKRICNKLNVSIIIEIDYDKFEKICKKNNFQLFVFQYDNISDKIAIVIAILKKFHLNIMIIQMCSINLMQINCLNIDLMITQSKRKIQFFLSILFIICLLRNVTFFENI